ncbi:hypothetical protein [Cellulosimicrobium marinum]|uniref:hypothetical protein n=1 Tax=Cellulosimicrobium marinum TaxID=1638992 RepID=UPI001E3C06A4|nr:hypothetical protein [Cellulosimicrobium marinum]MCB7137607.1 hypothetical protein [Cellulosimicrobium marinum]
MNDRSDQRRLTPGKVAGGVVAALGLLFAAWAVPEIRDGACTRSVVSWDWHPPLCGAEFAPVSDAEAVSSLRDFYGRSGGAEPERGWRLLSAEAQGQYPLDSFEEDWAPYAWAELMGAPRATGHGLNEFMVTYRTYTEDGWVDLRETRVVLQKSERGTLVADWDRGDRTAESERHTYTRVTLREESGTWQEPSADAAPAAPASHLSVGGGLTALCVLPAGASTDGETWLRTTMGWLPADRVTGHEAVTIVCDPRETPPT